MKLVPVGEAPHREIVQDPGVEVRARLCGYAVAADPRLELCLIEAERSGPSYTVDTLKILRERAPEDDLTVILGADQAGRLPSWHEPEQVLALATVAVAAREGLEREAALRRLEGLPGSEEVAFFDMPRVDISSSLVRERAGCGRPIRYLVPDKVAEHVVAEGLYGASMPVSAE